MNSSKIIYSDLVDKMKNEEKRFTDIRDAFSYLVNDCWENGLLTPEQRKELRVPKNEFNHGSISHKRMITLLDKYGSFKKEYKFRLKQIPD